MHLSNKGKKHTFLDFYTYENDVHEIINKIKTTIIQNSCSHLIINIAMLNFLDATRVCILTSTYHFSIYPDGNILWILKDRQTQHTINMLKLQNIETKVFNEEKFIRPIYERLSDNFQEALVVD